jgi:hypothetical protein
MYLPKFFHRAPGDDDRELLLIPGGDPIIVGIHMRESADEFLREEFSGIADAVAAFRRLAKDMTGAGYIETTHTRHTLRQLADPQPKPPWQQGLDDLMLAALSAPLKQQAKRLKALEATPAAREPLYLWLAAHHAVAADESSERMLQLAEAARDELAARKARKLPHYAWSIDEDELEARIFEVLSDAYLRLDDPLAALTAIEQAYTISPDQGRGAARATILCEHFPDRREEAFESAFKYGEFGGYEAITALPDYAAYLDRRKTRSKSKGWRWNGEQAAAEAELRAAEQSLGSVLPKDYRKFLGKRGSAQLAVRLPEASADLCFYGPAELATQRRNLFDFIVRTETDASEAIAYFHDAYGVSLRDLVPMAELRQHSRSMVIHLAPGDRFGWCFQWDHDGAWELEQATPGFDAALKAITDGIGQRDPAVLGFLGIDAV